MKGIIFGLAVILLVSGCSVGGNVGLVQRTKNAAGIASSQIPAMIFDRMGFKVQSAKWVEEAEDGFAKVALKVKAVKTVQNGSVYMSYNWDPEWRWSVEKSTQSVIPANKMAKDWMRGSM